jgi:hypothetical protein
LEAAVGSRVIYCAGDELYLFDNSKIYYMNTKSTSPTPFDNTYTNVLCLVDAAQGSAPPSFLVLNRNLFILQAASPNPAHRNWVKKRTGIFEFVMNPPDEVEMIQAFVLFSLTLSTWH